MNRPARTAPAFAASPFIRRIVLGTAFFLGLAAALAPRSPAVHAQEPKSPPAATAPKSTGKSVSITDGRGAEIKIEVGDSGRASVSESSPGARPGDSQPEAKDTEPPWRNGKPRKQARVIIDGGGDRDLESFNDLVHDEPALVTMVVGVVAVIFFAPVLAIALILWYRMRKARMLNETMLKLAEKGIVPTAEALDAVAGGKPAAASAVASYYEQAKHVRSRAAWSDLRKGVLLAGFGLALSMYSLLRHQEPNGIGLVLLFVGLGFVVLWWFEQRHLAPADTPVRNVPPGPGPTPGNPSF